MPRPRKADPRDRLVSFRCTEAEITRLHRRARDAGLSLSDYARGALLGDAAEPRTAPMMTMVLDNPAARLLEEQVRRIGVNINQIAHRMNALDIPPPADLGSLLSEIRLYVRQARTQ